MKRLNGFNARSLKIFTTAFCLSILMAIPSSEGEPVGLDSQDFESSGDSLFGRTGSEGRGRERIDAETVIAKVDGNTIEFGEIQAQVQQMLSQVPQDVPQETIKQQLPTLMSRTLNGLITEKLLKKAVADEGIEATEEDVDEQIAEIKTQLPEDRSMEELLERQGMTMADFRERLAEDLPIKKLVEKKVSEPEEPSDEEVAEFYEENKDQFVQPERVKARHILIGFEEDDSEEDKEKKQDEIEEIRAKIVEEDVDFSEMAKEHSTGPSASAGGELGEFSQGQMVPAFEEVAFSQEVGEVSEPVETQFGYHLILVDERSSEETVSLEEARERIKEHLMQQAQQEEVEEYIKTLRDEADIEIVKDLGNIQVGNNGQ